MNFRQLNIGARPDLAAIAVNWPVGYIGRLLFPVSGTAEIAGSFTHRGVVTDAAPEESRTWSSALGNTRITNTTKAYTCVKQEKRYVMTPDDVKEVGSLDAADKIGAMASKRSVMRKFEGDAAAAVFTVARLAAALELASGDEFAGIGYAANQVRRVKGSLSLVCSHNWLLAFLGLTAVSTRLQSVSGLAGYIAARDAALGLQPEVIASMLRTVLPFEQILVGDDDHWGTNADYAAVAMVPRIEGGDAVMAAKMDPIYGMSKWFRPDPTDPENLIGIETDWLPDIKVNAYDAVAHYNLLELNATGIHLVKLPTGTAFTTTSTTTTAAATTTTAAPTTTTAAPTTTTAAPTTTTGGG